MIESTRPTSSLIPYKSFNTLNRTCYGETGCGALPEMESSAGLKPCEESDDLPCNTPETEASCNWQVLSKTISSLILHFFRRRTRGRTRALVLSGDILLPLSDKMALIKLMYISKTNGFLTYITGRNYKCKYGPDLGDKKCEIWLWVWYMIMIL